MIKRTRNQTQLITDFTKSQLIYSSKFSNYLTNIISINNLDGNAGAVVQYLSSSENSFSDISFVDVTDKEDTISFIPVNRIFKLFKKSYKEVNKTVFNDYLRSEIDLASVHQFIKNYTGVWNFGRVEMKIGKFAKRINSSFSDSQIEDFVNQYKALYRSRNNTVFTLVSGSDIEHWYSYERYAHAHENSEQKGLGQLGNSCMRYGDDYLQLYTSNPEVCQLLILQSEDNKESIIGRALVWQLTDGRVYMDRIYCHFDSDMYLFRQYAAERGWLTHFDYKERKRKLEHHQIQLKEVSFGQYPYLDSFCFLDTGAKILSSKSSNKDNMYLRQADGGYGFVSDGYITEVEY